MKSVLWVSGFCLVVISCGSSHDEADRTAPGITTRDSAGVEIAELQANPWNAPVWAIADSVPAFRIVPDPGNPATLFARVRGVLRTTDGNMAVLDAGNHEVRIFDSHGVLVRKFGRRGEGPGEFQQPWRLLRGRGDSVVVAEINSGTLQVFPATSDSARLVRIPHGSATGTAHLLGTFADGDFLVIMNDLMHEPQVGRNPVHSSLHVVRSDGSAGPALGRQVSTEQVFRDGGGGRLVHAENLFWAEPGWAPLSDGYAWCLPREFHCDIWSKEGKHVRIVRAKFSGETIPAEAYTQLESQRLALVNTQNDSARVRRGIADGDRPNVFPILSLIRGDRNDRIWMREFVWRTDAKKVRWLVFEKTGKVLGTITLPADLWIYEIGDDYIVGTDLDENDVQRVVQYRYREATGISRQ